MLLRTLPIADLKPAPYNPRRPLKPGSPGWKRLERSLREFDLVQPIVWNEATGHVVGGHQRLEILKHQGHTTVDAVVVNLPLEREKALNIALNNSQVGGDWDAERLVEVLDELARLPDFDITMTGFDDRDLRDFLLEPANSAAVATNSEEKPIRVTLEVPHHHWDQARPDIDDLAETYECKLHVDSQGGPMKCLVDSGWWIGRNLPPPSPFTHHPPPTTHHSSSRPTTHYPLPSMLLTLSHAFPPHRPSCHAALLMDRFGIGPETARHLIAENLELPLQLGDIICFLGPSGPGKSSLLHAAAGQLEGAVWIDRVDLGDDLVIDGPGLPVDAACELLTRCGLGEPRLMLRTPDELSDGERFRYRLARAAALQPAWLVADEFTAVLDRTLAKVVAFNLRRLARRHGFGCLLATTHEDFLDDLQPDIVVRCELNQQPTVERIPRQPDSPISFQNQLETVVGQAADWPPFARWHYRGHDVACIRQVTLLRHGERHVGVCVFAAPAQSLRGRNHYFGLSGRWSRAQRQVHNAQITAISRVVLHPTYRGAGLAARFVRESCQLCSSPWIETLAVMGHLNPFFERAGFVRVDVPPRTRRRPSHVYGENRHGRGRLVAAAPRTEPVYYIFDNRARRRPAQVP